MDFAGPLLPSHPHKFTVYCGVVDAGSGYSRTFPGHGPTSALATSSLAEFIADVGAKLGFQTTYKPYVVRSDQGSAFISASFHEFLTERQIQQSLSCVYTPKQNSHIERTWGIVFGTARVILAAANLPPSMHPFALQTSTWITNRLPRPSRGQKSPFELLTRQLPDISYLYSFGCLCSITVPAVKRDGDRHFADRGEIGLYMGPSEQSPGSVVLLPASGRITVVPKLKVWEDQFPGLPGHRYDWFPIADQPAIQAPPDTPTPPQPGPPPGPAVPPPAASPPAHPGGATGAPPARQPAPDVRPVPDSAPPPSPARSDWDPPAIELDPVQWRILT